MAGGALVASWSLRLGSHIAARTAGISDDPRYAAFAREWGVDSPRKMFMFLQNQGFGSIPLVFAIFAGAISSVGLRISGRSRRVDPVGRHRRRSAGRRAAEEFPHRSREQGPGLRRRLWRWSRHPNYFFEWFGWLAYPVIALSIDDPLSYPSGWATLLAPVFMYWILVHVTGIPPLEEQMLRSRGERYRDYSCAPACSFRCHRKRSGYMSFVSRIIGTVERCRCRTSSSAPHPAVVLAHHDAVGQQATRKRRLVADEMAARAIAEHTDEANGPDTNAGGVLRACARPEPQIFSCFYKERSRRCREAEEEALRQTVEHADLADRQSMLELGCAGLASLWLARQFRIRKSTASRIRARSANISRLPPSPRLKNLSVITAT